LSVEVGGRLVVSDASFTIRAGEKVGLVGSNGAGKTSLLRVLAGEHGAAGPGGGSVEAITGAVRRRGVLGYLPQEPRAQRGGLTATVLGHILSGRRLDEAARSLERLRLNVEENPIPRNIDRFAAAEERYRAAGGYAAESEARRFCAGLGLRPDRVDCALDVLSGGERRRVELARILFAGAEVLLLDEPTNHLDTDAKTWLMAFLRAYRGALLVVSHDLALLDEAITRILHLDTTEVREYAGTYSQYLVARAADEARQARLAERQQTEIRRLSVLADAMRHQTAKRARKAKVLDRRVAKLRNKAITPLRRSGGRTRVRLPPPLPSGRLGLEATRLTKSYGGPAVFSELSFAVERRERLLVLGLNGAGKTTLLRILAGVASPDAGSVRLGHNVSVGYYAQEHELLDPSRTVIDHLRDGALVTEQQRRDLLGSFGLPGEMAFQDAGSLSGGEKTKLALAQLVAGRHNLLLLDEPTNNLDPPSREAVASALGTWPGTMIVVSHDPAFVAGLAPERVLYMPEGVVDFMDEEVLELVELA